jgi:CDP-glycerol glycerophosphotransferase (TagB/SpsB family)
MAMYLLKIFPTIMVKGFIQMIFYLSCLLFKVNNEKVTFASYRATEIQGNLYYIYKELHGRYPNWTCNFLFKKYSSSLLGKFHYVLHMVKASYHLATSRYFIIDDYYFPVYVIKPRQGTDIIQLWHAAGAFKKFGLSTVDKEFGPSSDYLRHVKVHSNYSKVFVSSSEVIPFYAEAFDMPSSRIFPLGVPRTDYFFNKREQLRLMGELQSEFPEIQGRKIILYAPTFRGKSHYQESFHCPIDFSAMRETLGDEYVLLIHLHPYMRSEITIKEEDKDFVFHVKEKFNIEQLLVLADILLTDYSSVIFDYSLLVRPIAFIADDLEEYIRERDFYFPFLSFIPGPFFHQTQDLIEWIQQDEFDLKKIEQFRNRFFTYFDGKTSKRIVDNLIEKS